MDMNRRQFFKASAAGLVGSSLAAMGFSPNEAVAAAREYKLTRTTESRSTCPYCSVSCGMVVYTLGDRSKNVRPTIVHIEGDPDNPVNRGDRKSTRLNSSHVASSYAVFCLNK